MMLNGLRVVELGTYVAAPAAAAMLAEWGANVIKIESPEGDPFRRGYESITDDGLSPGFDLDNRGKRSVVLDFANPDGHGALMRLLEHTDIFLTNLRPAALYRAKLDWDTLSSKYSRLIYASITGYGIGGPDQDLPGFDVTAFWSRAGLAALMTPKGAAPAPLRTAVGDHMCALAATTGILTALIDRQKTGRGRLVEASLMRSGVYAIGADIATYLRIGRVASTRPRAELSNPLSSFFKCDDDRWVSIMTRDSRDWPSVATVAGRSDLVDDPLFATERARRQNAEALVDALDAGFAQQSYEEIARKLVAADLIWAPVQTPEQVINDPQAQAAGCFVDVSRDRGDAYRAPATPVRFPGWQAPLLHQAPSLGQHTEEVFSELDLRVHPPADMPSSQAGSSQESID